MRQIVGNFKCYGYELDALELTNLRGKNSRPSSGLPPEDGLQSLALSFIGPFVDDKTHPNFGFISPDVAFESTKSQQIETAESNVAEMPL